MTKSRGRGRVRNSTKYQDKPSAELPSRMLIVTEGEVTEVEYFKCLRAELGLGQRQVVVIGSDGEAAPVQVVKHAQQKLERDDNFKYVYCVFDMDGDKDRFEKGIRAVQKMKQHIEKIEAITSVPCFEFWLWLHVTDRIRSYPTTGNPCQMLKSDIMEFDLFENYSTSAGIIESIFDSLDSKRSDALKLAKYIFENAEGVGEGIYLENPSTRVYVVVEDLQRMSSEKKKAKRLESQNTR